MPDFFSENLAPSVTQETDAALVSLGQRGCIATDSIATGNFVAIQCIQDCSFDLLTTVSGDGDFFFLVDNGVTIPAGTIFYGAFTNISSTGGIYIAYKA